MFKSIFVIQRGKMRGTVCKRLRRMAFKNAPKGAMRAYYQKLKALYKEFKKRGR